MKPEQTEVVETNISIGPTAQNPLSQSFVSIHKGITSGGGSSTNANTLALTQHPHPMYDTYWQGRTFGR